MINISDTQQLKTSVTYYGTGSQTNFDFPFDYLRKAFIHVTINDVEVSDYSIDSRTIIFETAPSEGAIINIYRSTDTTRLVAWADASVLKASDMTIAQVQQLHILEEGQDWSKLNSLYLDENDSKWQGNNHPIKNISDPVDAKDVVTKGYMETVQDGFIRANTALKDEATKQAGIATKIATDLGLVDEAVTNAQNAANAAEAVAPEYAKTKEVLDNIANYTNTATEQAIIATAKANAANVSATNAAQSYANADAIATQLTEYLATKETLTAPAVDKTLLIEGAAADSKVVGELKNNIINIEVTGGCKYYENTYLSETGTLVNRDGYTAGVIKNIHKGTVLKLTANVGGFWGTLYGIYADGTSVKLLGADTGYSDEKITITDDNIVEARAWTVNSQSELKFEKISLQEKICDNALDISNVSEAINEINNQTVELKDSLYEYKIAETIPISGADVVAGRIYTSEYYKNDANFKCFYYPVISGDKYSVDIFTYGAGRTILFSKTKENDGKCYVLSPNESITSDIRHIIKCFFVPYGYKYIVICIPNGMDNNITVKHYLKEVDTKIDVVSKELNNISYEKIFDKRISDDSSLFKSGYLYTGTTYKQDSAYQIKYYPISNNQEYDVNVNYTYAAAKTVVLAKSTENDGNVLVVDPNESSDVRSIRKIVSNTDDYKYIAISTPKGLASEIYEKTDEVLKIDQCYRRKMYVGQNCIITKLSEAMLKSYDIKNCDVYIEDGEYDILSELDVDTIISNDSLKWGLPIGNGCRYYFSSGAIVKCNYTGNNKIMNSIFSIFTANSEDFTIYGGHFEGSNIRYIVHDETAGVGTYTHKYCNVNMKLDNTNNENWPSKMCIGGGLGKCATIIVDSGCYRSVGSTLDSFGGIYYHNPDSGYGSDFKNLVVVKNVYFDEGSVTVIPLGDSTKISEFYCSNCSLQFPPKVHGGNNFVLKQWNNEIRTN